jgi:hypothetical protein
VDVGDVQLLELLGYDAEGNVFTSLEGIRFTWIIEQNNLSSEFIKFIGSSMKTTENRHILESLGF